MASAVPFVEGKLRQKQIVVFSKESSPEGRICQQMLEAYKGLTEDRYEWINIDKRGDCSQVEDFLWKLSGKNNREVPLLFIKRRCWGGYQDMMRMQQESQLQRLFDKLCLNPEDENEDLPEEERELLDKVITVRVQPLVETELVVKVADWLHIGPIPADFDTFLDRDSDTVLTAGLEVFSRQLEAERKKKKKSEKEPEKVEGEKVVEEEDPVWMYVGGTRKHRRSSVAIRVSATSSSGLLLKKPSAVAPNTNTTEHQ